MADEHDEKRDGQRFIGHTSELDTFKRWLTNTDPNAPWILFFHDAFEQPEKKGGVGKTWLLRECAALAKQHDEQVAVVIIDFFSIADRDGAEIARRIVESLQKEYPAWSPESFLEVLHEYHDAINSSGANDDIRDKLYVALSNDLATLDQRPGKKKQLLILFDTFEVIEEYPVVAVLGYSHTFPENYRFQQMKVVIAGRNAPNWKQQNWKGREKEIQRVAIKPFSLEEMVQFINENCVVIEHISPHSAAAEALYACTEGRPILVGLVVDMLNNRIRTLDQLLATPLSEFEPSLVMQINDLRRPTNWFILFMAHLYHRFNVDFLEWLFHHSLNVKNLVQDIQTQDLAANLVELSFVRLSARGDNFTLHDEMRRLVNKYNWPAQEKQTGLYRSELSRLAIRYYEQKIDNEPDAQLRQVYTVEMLYNKLYLDVNDGFKFFEQHFKRSVGLWQTPFARSLLQEVQKFRPQNGQNLGKTLSEEQRYGLIMAEASLLRREENNEGALRLYQWLEENADDYWREDHLAETLFEKGNCYQQMSNFSVAIECFTRALFIEETRRNEVRKALILGMLGYCYRRLGELDQAASYYEQSMDIYKKINDQRGYADVLNSIGVLYRLQGKTQEALRRCKVAWRIRQDLSEKGEASEVGVGISLSSLGTIYLKMGDLVNAQHFFENAHTIYERNKYRKGTSSIHNRFGQLAMAKSELSSAMSLFKEAYKASLGVDAESEINSLNKQGRILLLQRKAQEAVLPLESAIQRAREVRDYYQLVESLIDLADALEHLDQHKDSRIALQEAEEIATKYHYFFLLGLAEDFRAENRYRIGKFKEAFKHFGAYCYYMARYNPEEYEKAVSKTIDALLNLPREQIRFIMDELTAYWQGRAFEEKQSLMFNALDEVSLLIKL